jgi:FHA domain-containing protein
MEEDMKSGMADRGNGSRRAAGGPLRTRNRRRWALAAALAGTWLAFMAMSGSIAGGSLLLVLTAAAGLCLVVALRSLGIGRDHPLVRPLTTRPWRDGRDVLHVALRHLPEVFIITPNGSLLAPSAVELCMNPGDVESLAEVIDLSLVSLNAAEAYEAEIIAHSARVARGAPLEVSVVSDPDVPEGRYRLRQRRQQAPRLMADAAAWETGAPVPVPGPVLPAGVPRAAGRYRDGFTRQDPFVAATQLASGATVTTAAQAPLLRLVTGGAVVQTRVSGAHAGRGREVELQLPPEPTVSRSHAKFTCTGGEWRMTGLGRNGVVLNGKPLTGEHAVRDGDIIQWGQQAGALTSRVEIG